MKLSPYTLDLSNSQLRKSGSLFLKGPIKFDWICSNIPDPTSRLVLVSQAFMDMEGKSEISLSQKIWKAADISGKDARHRALQNLRSGVSGYEVILRPGRASELKKRS
jgi:hypothetical protein